MKVRQKDMLMVGIGCAVVIITIVISVLLFYVPYQVTVGSDWTKLHFDVKLLRFNTDIQVYKNDAQIGTVKGNILRIITDPLTYYDRNGNKIAYADDQYHFIAQDSHTIICDGEVQAEMVGRIKYLGEAYDIYGRSGEKIARADFDFLNLTGKIVDGRGEAVASYKANPILKDFDVYVSPSCQIDETTLIMIFSSYYSDYAADSSNNSNSNSNR